MKSYMQCIDYITAILFLALKLKAEREEMKLRSGPNV
jgi:hypothetical protein